MAPRLPRPRGWNVRRECETRLAIIKEHLGHITHSLNRLKTLTNELEDSLGISLPDDFVWPRPDALSGSPDVTA